MANPFGISQVSIEMSFFNYFFVPSLFKTCHFSALKDDLKIGISRMRRFFQNHLRSADCQMEAFKDMFHFQDVNWNQIGLNFPGITEKLGGDSYFWGTRQTKSSDQSGLAVSKKKATTQAQGGATRRYHEKPGTSMHGRREVE